MEQYKDYFNSFKNIKTKKNIIDDLSSLFPEVSFNDTLYKKLIDFFIKDGTLSEISEKRKRFFISSVFLVENNITIENLYSKEKLGVTTGNALKKNKFINFDEYLKDDAIVEFTLEEMFK
jgi:hypothetical protein